MKPLLRVPFHRMKHFFMLLLNQTHNSWFAQNGCFQSGTHTSITYPAKPGFINFQAFLTSLNSISLGRQPTFRVFGWIHMFEAKTRSAFKLICFVIFCCLMCSSDMGRLPGATCRYSLHTVDTVHRAIATGMAMPGCVCRRSVLFKHLTDAGKGTRCSWASWGCLAGPNHKRKAVLLVSKTSEEFFEQPRKISLEIIWWNW